MELQGKTKTSFYAIVRGYEVKKLFPGFVDSYAVLVDV